tara:strand:+ start:68 stop:460 length:393 start_codon:yes stop_codon:yes gene_type:complete
VIDEPHLDMSPSYPLSMKIVTALVFASLLLLYYIPGCVSDDSSAVVGELNVLIDVVIGEDGENDSMNATAMLSGGESPYSYQWELDGSQMLSMNSYLKMGNLSQGQHIVSVSVSSNDGQVEQATASFNIE